MYQVDLALVLAQQMKIAADRPQFLRFARRIIAS